MSRVFKFTRHVISAAKSSSEVGSQILVGNNTQTLLIFREGQKSKM